MGKKQSRETQDLTAAVTWTHYHGRDQGQGRLLQLGMPCKSTCFPISPEETCVCGTLEKNDLILVSILFYNFISLFLVIACYSHLNYSPPLWNSHPASTWTHVISFSQAPCYLHCIYFFFCLFPHQSASPFLEYILVPLPESSQIYLYLSAVIQPRTECSKFCLGSHQRHWEEPVPPSAAIWCLSLHR